MKSGGPVWRQVNLTPRPEVDTNRPKSEDFLTMPAPLMAKMLARGLQYALVAAGLLHGRASGFAPGGTLEAAPWGGMAGACAARRVCLASPRIMMTGTDERRVNRAVYTISYRVGGKRHGEAYFAEYCEVKADGSAVTNKKTGAQPGGPLVPEMSQEQARDLLKAQVITAWLPCCAAASARLPLQCNDVWRLLIMVARCLGFVETSTARILHQRRESQSPGPTHRITIAMIGRTPGN